MDTTLATTQERIDDIPLIIEVAKRLGLPEMLERAVGTHGHQRGLENGWLATLWIAYILSENDHRKSAVQDWSLKRRETLSQLCGQPIRDVELNDDRLGNLLRHMSDGKAWEMIETQLWRGTVLAYDLKIEGVRLDSTTSYGYHTVGEDGLMQLGHSKDHRPDLPQLKLMAAAAEPMGQLVACDVHPGHRADDGLYVPLIRRVRQMVGRSGILYLGDAKMAAQATRADIEAANDYYVVPMPRTGVAGTKLGGWLDAITAAEHQLQPIMTEHGLYGSGYRVDPPAECQGPRPGGRLGGADGLRSLGAPSRATGTSPDQALGAGTSGAARPEPGTGPRPTTAPHHPESSGGGRQGACQASGSGVAGHCVARRGGPGSWSAGPQTLLDQPCDR